MPKPLSAAGCPSSQVAAVAKQFLPGQGPGMVGVSFTPRRGWPRPAGVGGTHPSMLSPYPRSLAPVPGVPAGFGPGAAARDGGHTGSDLSWALSPIPGPDVRCEEWERIAFQ